MAKVNGNYETVFIANTNQTDEQIAALVAKFKELVEKNGTLTEISEWGKRRLAYTIDHQSEGYYVYMSFTSLPAFPAELDRIYNITDGIIRSLVVEKAQ